MGNSVSRVLPCFTPPKTSDQNHQADLIFSEPLDETLGHSFCYIRSLIPGASSGFSPSQSDRFSPSQSDRLEEDPNKTTFKSISGASVSANSSNPRTILSENQANHNFSVNGFDSTSSFTAVPLQPVPRGASQQQLQEFGFMSGPLERGFMSGPIERGFLSGPLDNADGLHFSAPLGGLYMKKRKKGFSKKAFLRSFSERQRPWVVPVLNLVGLGSQSYMDNKKWYSGSDTVPPDAYDSYLGFRSGVENTNNLQWAHGKAGEDRVHVVVSEELGWLFVGIYDGFNGPDAPEFLMNNLYNAVFNEFEGLLWDVKEDTSAIERQKEDAVVDNVSDDNSSIVTYQDREMIDFNKPTSAGSTNDEEQQSKTGGKEDEVAKYRKSITVPSTCGSVKRVTFQSEQLEVKRGKPLRELLAEEDEDELDLSGSGCFTFSVDNEFLGRRITVSAATRTGMCAEAVGGFGEEDSRDGNGAEQQNYASIAGKVTYPNLPQRRGRSLLLSKLKHGLSKHKESHRKFFPWRYDWEKEKFEVQTKVQERSTQKFRKHKTGLVDHALVLRALAQALEAAEVAYLEMTDKVLDRNPELALMGSCLLVMLMKDEDVYVMNVGDSRAIVAQYQLEAINSCGVLEARENEKSELEGIVEESSKVCEVEDPQIMKLTPLQLSTDHSTNIEEVRFNFKEL